MMADESTARRAQALGVLIGSALLQLSLPAWAAALEEGAESAFILADPAPAPARLSGSLQLAAADVATPGSREALFGDDDDDLLKPAAAQKSESPANASPLKGFVQFNAARAYESPVHWSQMMTRVSLGAQGDLGGGIKWKLGARYDYDAVFNVDDYYPSDVKKDQRSVLYLLENYIDVGAGDWEFRLGKQNVIWGEMVGLFFADVVSARNMREFILPTFDLIRIPQWAARAEYFKDDFHAELLWIPVASYNEIGKPGAEFYPFAPPDVQGFTTEIANEVLPSRDLSHTNYGIRVSTLSNGWDASAFAYSSMDIEPTFYRQVNSVPQPTITYEARHNRIDQFGGTLAKDFGSVVFKAEGLYTHGREFYVSTADDSDGVVPKDTVDWAVGLDFSLPADTRLNLQLFQRYMFDHEPDLLSDRAETGYSVLLNHKLTSKLEAELTWIASFNQTDWLLRPRLVWNFERNWRLAVGADVFDGAPLGLFGRYADKDRVYAELRYSF